MWVTQDQIERAKEIDLLTYLRVYEPDNLQKAGRDTYSTKDHDSLKISNGVWHWFSKHIGGKNALDYLIKVRGYSFPEAVSLLSGSQAITDHQLTENTSKNMAKKEHRVFSVPPLNQNIDRVKRYLMKRGIDGHLVDFCNREGLIFEDAKYHNCVFIGKDDAGVPKFGSLRSTFSDFKIDIYGSDKRYSFHIFSEEKAETVHLFEAAIDLLSYVTLEMRAGHEWFSEDMLSLSGIYETDNRQDIPLALKSYLERNPQIKEIVVHFDNDSIGRGAAKHLIDALQDRYRVIDQPPPSGKDYNDHLQNELKKVKECTR